jgi:hypothetical protein
VYFCSDEYDMLTSKAKQAATSKARQSAESFAALLSVARADGPPKMDQGRQHDSWCKSDKKERQKAIRNGVHDSITTKL